MPHCSGSGQLNNGECGIIRKPPPEHPKYKRSFHLTTQLWIRIGKSIEEKVYSTTYPYKNQTDRCFTSLQII